MDVTYATRGDAPVKLDIVTPPGPGPWPTVMWIHGGAWKLGGRAVWPHAMFLVGHGYAVASIDYRFTNVARFPAQLDDCAAALDFLTTHADEYRLDPARMAVAGESAGGHLAALLGQARGPAATVSEPGRVRCVIDLFGPTDIPTLAGKSEDLTRPVLQLLGGTVMDKPDLARAASPLLHVSPTDPPFLILHGDKDTQVPIAQSEQFAAALEGAHVPVQFVVVTGAGHAQPAFWTSERRTTMVAFLQRTLAKT